MIIQRLFSSNKKRGDRKREKKRNKPKSPEKVLSLKELKKVPEYKESLKGIEVLEKNRKKIVDLGMEMTTTFLMAYMNHPLTVVDDKFALHIVREGWFEPKYRPLVNGLDMQDLLLLDLETGELFMFDVEKPDRLTQVMSIKEYVEKIIEEIKWRGESSGYNREVVPFLKEYRRLCL